MHNIVIIGGNFAGVSAAHYLLRHVLPLLNSTNNDKSEYKVTLVSPSDHTFFKIAAPRIMGSAETIPPGKLFASIPDAFSQYKSSEFSFVQGEAVHVDESTKTVSISNSKDPNNTSVRYDSLVIATGTTSANPVWTLHGAHENTATALTDIHKRLPKAKTVLIAGGGPSGVETAGEIAYNYKAIDITLLSGSTRLLSRLRHARVVRDAEKQLSSLKVKTIHNLKVVSSTELADGKVSLKLSDGSTKTVDIYIDATGGVPNTSFLPPAWLDEQKRVAADAKTLRATKAPAGVYSVGDVASYSKMGVPDATWSIPALGYSIWSDSRKSNGGNHSNNSKSATLKEKTYKQIEEDMQFVPIGPKGGVGVIFGWWVPSFFVWLLKGRNFMIDRAPDMATGAQFLKA